MAATSTELLVKLVADSKGFSAELGNASRSVDTLSKKMDAFGKSAQDVGKRMSLAISLPVAAIAKAGYDELAQSQQVLAQTGAVLKSTGAAANVTAKGVDGLAQRLSALSGVDDEVIASSENILLTFTKIRNEAGRGNDVFDQATKAVLDMSTALGEDLQSASIQVGKALNDPIQGVTALRRVGVSFTAAQREQIKVLVETGNTLGAQKLILRELNTEFGGSAKAFGNTLPGQIAKAKNAFDEMSASLLVTALPAITAVTHGLQDFAKWVQDAPEPIRLMITALAGIAAIGGPVLYIVGTLARSFSAVAEVAPKFASALSSSVSAIGVTGAAIGLTVGALALLQKGLDSFGPPATHVTATVDELTNHQQRLQHALVDASADMYKWRNALSASKHGTEEAGVAQRVLAGKMEDIVAKTRKLAAESPTLARELIDVAKAAGLPAEAIAKLNRIVGDSERAHAAAAAAAKKDADALNDVGDGAVDAKQAMEDLNNYIKAQEDASLNLDRAYLTLNNSLDALYISFHDATQSAADHQRAILDTKSSIEDYGHAVFEANKVSSGSTEEAARAQVYSLGLVAGGLAPGSDLRVWLEQYIDRLSNGIPKHVATLFEVVTYLTGLSQADQEFLNSQSRAVQGFATGGVVPGPIGAPQLAVVHGGEEVLTPAQRAAGGTGDGFSVSIGTIVAPSPVEAANQIVQRLRAESFLAGMN